jgi:hypothetical protein
MIDHQPCSHQSRKAISIQFLSWPSRRPAAGWHVTGSPTATRWASRKGRPLPVTYLDGD